MKVTAALNGSSKTFEAIARVDTPVEAEYYRNGGILPYVLKQLAARDLKPAGVRAAISRRISESFLSCTGRDSRNPPRGPKLCAS